MKLRREMMWPAGWENSVVGYKDILEVVLRCLYWTCELCSAGVDNRQSTSPFFQQIQALPGCLVHDFDGCRVMRCGNGSE